MHHWYWWINRFPDDAKWYHFNRMLDPIHSLHQTAAKCTGIGLSLNRFFVHTKIFPLTNENRRRGTTFKQKYVDCIRSARLPKQKKKLHCCFVLFCFAFIRLMFLVRCLRRIHLALYTNQITLASVWKLTLSSNYTQKSL